MTALVVAASGGRFAFFFVFGVLIPLLVLGLVAYGIYQLVLAARLGDGATPPPGSARVLLDERFARGEIDADDYVRRRTLLDGSVAPTTHVVDPSGSDEPATTPTSAASTEASPD